MLGRQSVTTKPKIIVSATAAVAAALLAIGCSSTETKNDYVDTVNEIQADALDAFNQTASSTPKNKQALVEQLEAGEAALADAVTDLQEVEVPDEAEGSHPDLVAGIEDLRALFAKTAKKVENSDTTEAFAAVTSLGTEGTVIGTKIDQAITEINDDLGAE
jgi:hypothetical protein